jgi:hypothetical protein
MLSSITKKQIESYLFTYLESQIPELKIKKGQLFTCPFCATHQIQTDQPSCTISEQYYLQCHDPSCGDLGNIFAIVRKLQTEFMKKNDEEIANYLIALLDIQTEDANEKLFAMYAERGFKLFPLQKQGQGKISKEPISGVSWLKNISGDINQWKDWLKSGLGLGLALGQVSNVIAIDVDDDKTEEKLKDKFNSTFEQSTKRGRHRLYYYEESFSFLKHDNCRDKGYDMEVRANNAYIVVAPTSVEGEKREWNNLPIVPMTEELKKFLLELIDKKEDTADPIQQAINDEVVDIKNKLSGWDGNCNDNFIKFGGILRKKLSMDGVGWVLYNLNKMLTNPMENKDIKAMTYQIAKYSGYDKKELAESIYERLIKVEVSSVRELKESLKQESKDIEDALRYLIQEGKVLKVGRSYKPIQKVEWQTDFMSVAKTCQYKVPYFEEYNHFSDASLIILGASTGVGKSSLACNLLYEFIQNNVTPYYICTEAGSRFGIIAARLGIKEGEFKFKLVSDVSTVELEDNAVTIIDWLTPPNSEYAKTDTMYKQLNDQLVKHGGLLIVFVQVRGPGEREGEFFAKDLISQYASFAATYNYEIKVSAQGGSKDNLNTYFKTEKMRASKVGKQYLTIPMKYDPLTYRVIERK